MKKLDLKQLENVSGGTPDESFAYLDELCVKYGFAPGEYGKIDGLMTEEEMDYVADLFWKDFDVDFSTFPGL